MDGGRWVRPSGPRDLTASEVRFIFDTGRCPYCPSLRRLERGPRGGASVNLICTETGCGSRFNVVAVQYGFVPLGQFLGTGPEDMEYGTIH